VQALPLIRCDDQHPESAPGDAYPSRSLHGSRLTG